MLENTCSLFGSEGSHGGQVFVYQRIPSPLDGSFEEVAQGKLTNSSDLFGFCPPNYAVDGSLDESKFYHSSTLFKPWWWVDLGEEKIIHQIQIYPRQHNSYDHRFYDVEVRVGNILVNNGNFSSYTLLCTYEKNYVYLEGQLLCTRYNGVIGRYVSIQIIDTRSSVLQISEVAVYALKINDTREDP
ncbi:uncharacterized protein [Palaemon carinicauda]|uniref:uncharacterized protein n=1 Tax=Palaemon carinicauda TaxID=392227 RepID=UPI0035B59B5E